MLLTEIDHVAIAVNDLDAAIDYHVWAFGATVAHREVVERDGVEEALLRVGQSYIQLSAAVREQIARRPLHREARRGHPPHRLPRRRLCGRPRGDEGGRGDSHRRRPASRQPWHDGGVHPPQGELRHADRTRAGVTA